MINLLKLIIFVLVTTTLHGNDIQNNLSNIKCSRIFIKQSYTVCYDDVLKSPILNTYILNINTLALPSINKRPRFYSEPSLPIELQSKPSQYVKTGFDKGHLANDSSFDHNINMLNETYSLINIIPQYPLANRRTWRLLENYERKITLQYNKLVVYNYITYTNIKINGLAIPNDMYKILIYDKNNTPQTECYKVNNNNDKNYHSQSLEYYLIPCDSIKI